MLTCSSDEFLEVDDDDILALHRSTEAVVFKASSGESFNVQAFLLLHRQADARLCHAAFHCRELKRSLLFAVSAANPDDLPEHGAAELRRLGFALTPVNINLSPAMRQVVLRDIPPLRRPTAKSKESADQAALVQEGESLAMAGDSDSAIAKATAIKLRLNAQRSLEKKVQALRAVLEQALQVTAPVPEPLPTPVEAVGQTDGSTGKLAEVEQRLAAERGRRMHVEEVLAAAEKRIRELEELLVGAETRSAEAVQLKKKIAGLEKRGKELGRKLEEVEARGKAAEQQHEALAEALVACQEQAAVCQERLTAGAVAHAAALAESDRRLCSETARSAAVDAELAGVRNEWETVSTERDNLHGEFKAAVGRINLLETGLASATEKTAQSAAAESRTAEAWSLLEKLTAETGQLRDHAEQQGTDNKKLQKELAASRKRGDTLASKLKAAEKALAEAVAAPPAPAVKTVRDEHLPPRTALAEAHAELDRERRARAQLEEQLDAAHEMLKTLEKALKMTREPQLAVPVAGGGQKDARQVQELLAQLSAFETQMEQERLVSRKAAKAHADAQKRIVELEQALRRLREEPPATPSTTVVEPVPASAKLLPHELRPPPKPGALLRPDWDLQGLPCQSADQIPQAWESVYNVQLSLEGYPSQYCAAFMVVLRQGDAKQLYLLFSLKKSKHTLVCVPAQPPRDEAALRKAISETQKFLKMSGFELDEIAAADIAGTLGGYFLGG